jgi:hypothetical protein
MTVTRLRSYYSARTGKNPEGATLTLGALISLVRSAYQHFDREGYFAEQFGYWCVDQDDVSGKAGSDIPNYVLLHLRRDGLWPFAEKCTEFEEHDLFDMIEFLHDHVSKPTGGHFHSFSGCGMHWNEFDETAGRAEFRQALNQFLENYGHGFELNDCGEIVEVGPTGLKHIFEAKAPQQDPTVMSRITSAVTRFRRFGSSIDERRQAVRDLADVLERLRPQIKTALLEKDEHDLFNLANNFGIRHFNSAQKSKYDPAVWLSWMFYYYLATIYACLNLIERQERGLISPLRGSK